MNRQAHWQNVYLTKGRDEVSWFREHLDTSLTLIAGTSVSTDAAVIDVGGGNSSLARDLVAKGFIDVTVLDISAAAIADSKERLGAKAEAVNWIVGDITEADLSTDRFDVWHDRAVFHFLTDAADRRRYIALATRSVKPGGHIIIAAFSPDGPQKCSSLDVVRYSHETMHREFGSGFQLIKSVGELHHTPFGTTQDFIYCCFRKA